ncbi:MAG: FAD-dependent oxidoreductase [Candidatus Dormibacteraeota bacterium]|nr:FAD-dependent oxidoreductase [Candidatus Dormibacteraeota bacterium]
MADLTVYGASWCPDCHRSKAFLSAHRIAFDWVDIDQDKAGLAVVERLQNGGRTIPTIVFPDGSQLFEPSDEELANKLGIAVQAEHGDYDLVIVGGGPAGLSAAIYAAREGISVVVVDSGGLGGNAGVTERIDNYPGFPEGIGGAALMNRFEAQARRYQVELVAGAGVRGLGRDGQDLALRLSTGQELRAHAVLVATGSTYRRLGIPGEDALIGAGIHFCATCDGPFYRGADELLVVGGGNAGLEEGLFLAQFAKKIRIVQNEATLTASRLLQDKINSDPRFEVHTSTVLEEFRGQRKLEEVVARDTLSGQELRWHPTAAFIFIGQTPNSELLGGVVDLDRWGFVITDDAYRTSLPGVYAAGDVRARSTKQLAAAVGEGAAALLAVRSYLQKHDHLAVVDVNS